MSLTIYLFFYIKISQLYNFVLELELSSLGFVCFVLCHIWFFANYFTTTKPGVCAFLVIGDSLLKNIFTSIEFNLDSKYVWVISVCVFWRTLAQQNTHRWSGCLGCFNETLSHKCLHFALTHLPHCGSTTGIAHFIEQF